MGGPQHGTPCGGGRASPTLPGVTAVHTPIVAEPAIAPLPCEPQVPMDNTIGTAPLSDRQGRPRPFGKRRPPYWQNPDALELGAKKTAEKRMDELQHIFASRDSDKCEALQARLAALDELVAWLKTQIASLEQKLKDTQQRKKFLIDERGRGIEEEEAITNLSGIAPLTTTGNDVSTNVHKKILDSVSKQYDEEVLTPILTKRRTVARIREAETVHEKCLHHIKEEIKTVQQRICKQQAWMNKLDKQTLEAEIEKARWDVRLNKCERRVSVLGNNLSQAYETMSKLLEERMEVEDQAARNHALVSYLNMIGRADLHNEANFTMNRNEVLALLERCERSQECQARSDELMEQVRNRQHLTDDIIRQADKLQQLGVRLKILWNKVPATLRELVSIKVQRSRHNVREGLSASLEELVGAAAKIGAAHRESAQMLTVTAASNTSSAAKNK